MHIRIRVTRGTEQKEKKKRVWRVRKQTPTGERTRAAEKTGNGSIAGAAGGLKMPIMMTCHSLLQWGSHVILTRTPFPMFERKGGPRHFSLHNLRLQASAHSEIFEGRSHQVMKEAEDLVRSVMGKWDASHDPFHVLRVRNLALSLAVEEQLPPESMEIVELASLLHDIDDHKYARGDGEGKRAARFLESHGVEPAKREKIMAIINGMGFKEELAGVSNAELPPEFGVVQDADRLDAIGAIGIARCLTFGGSRNRVLHDPDIQPRVKLSKEEYMKQDGKQTTMNHFHEKLLKLKDLMKTKAGRKRAQRRHIFMQNFLKEFYEEWEGNL